MTDTEDLAAFRAEVRAFLAESLTPELARAGRRATSVFAHPDHSIAWQKILTAKGWGAIDWPVEYGGPGWTPTQRFIWSEELAAELEAQRVAYIKRIVGLSADQRTIENLRQVAPQKKG